MISLRYHLVTIVAVFLALAIGLLAGSAFVEPELVDQLQQQTDRLRSQVREQETLLTEIRAEVAALDGFADAALPYLAANRLLGDTVVVVTQEGVEDAVIDQTQLALADGGAEVVAVLSARSTMLSPDPETQALLAEILGRPDALAADLPGLTADALAERLASGSSAAVPDDDLLNRLLSAGFLDTDATEGTLEEIGVPGQIVVVLGGGPSEAPTLPPGSFAVPLVDALSSRGVPVAAGESAATPAEVSFVAGVRDSGDDGTVTVDDLDLTIGAAALVLGVDRLLATGVGGDYGIKEGAEPLPPLS